MYFLANTIKKLCFLLLISPICLGQTYKPKPVLALLGAFDAEVKLVIESLEKPKTHLIHGLRFTTGKIGNQRVVVAETGIGKVNAAITTTLLLSHFRPSAVVFTGIAGAIHPDLQPGDLVIARQTGYYDYRTFTTDKQPNLRTRNPATKQLNPAMFPADSALLAGALTTAQSLTFTPIPDAPRSPSVLVGTVVTGDQFVSSDDMVNRLRTEFKADATEMEGAAVAQVCYQQQVPCLIIRSMSDKANANARRDMDTFLSVAASNSARLVVAIATNRKP